MSAIASAVTQKLQKGSVIDVSTLRKQEGNSDSPSGSSATEACGRNKSRVRCHET
jgi:hypothetical protein